MAANKCFPPLFHAPNFYDIMTPLISSQAPATSLSPLISFASRLFRLLLSALSLPDNHRLVLTPRFLSVPLALFLITLLSPFGESPSSLFCFPFPPSPLTPIFTMMGCQFIGEQIHSCEWQICLLSDSENSVLIFHVWIICFLDYLWWF